ncbi:MAG: hypothetical protein H6605_02105 [Flavobacteriales bacterium]|nr:hypothetical protein [Flavobacteriales bacterium]
MTKSWGKYKLIFALICFQTTTHAQVVINSSNMPSANDTVRYSIAAAATNLNLNSTGPDHFWDYSGLNSNSQGIYEFKSSLNTPYLLNFGFTAIGLKIADSLGVGQMGLTNIYNFFKNSSQKWENVGIGFQLSVLPLPQAGKHTKPDVMFNFPLTYPDQDSGDFSLRVPLKAVVVTIGTYFQDGNRLTTVDGYGKISTPYKKNIDCIRVKSVIKSMDSIAVAIQGQDPINFAFPNNRIEYRWLSTTEKIPMLEITGTDLGGNFTPSVIRFRDNPNGLPTLNTVNLKDDPLKIYPSPAREKIVIEPPFKITGGTRVFILDVNGKKINDLECQAKDNTYELNILNLSSGKYITLILNENQVYFGSFLKN